MRRLLLAVIFIAFFLFSISNIFAQSNQTVANGSSTTAVNFSGASCEYNWVNSNPSIGLPASGTGNIASFTATNNSSIPVMANITATPVPTGFAYIANWNSANVSVISTANNSFVATIPVGLNPFGVCISHSNKYVYVANISSNSVSVINIAQNTVSATIQVGTSPYSICISPDDTRLYVVNNQDNSISVVNTATNTVSSTIQISASPYAIAISPDGSRVYVAHNIMSNSKVTVINTSNNQIVTTIPVAVAPEGLIVSPNGSSLYATNVGANGVTVINTSTNTIAKFIPVGSSPEGITISSDGSKVYTANYNSSNVSVISTVSNSVVSTIPVGSGPTGISASPNGQSVYVTNDNDNTMSVINMASNTVTNTVSVGQYPDSQGIFVSNTFPTSCSPIIFTITVNPTSTPAVIAASTVTGNITACVGTASATPNIQQFTVSGNTLTSAVTATAPTGFEVSLSETTGYGNTIMLNQSSGSLSNVIVYVRSAPGDAIGQISGNVVLGSIGAANVTVAVSGTINALPTTTTVPNQTVTSGAGTTAVNFTGTGSSFTWTNDTPGIGLAASGTGNISSFIAVNTGNAPLTANITVTSANKQAGFEYITDETANQVAVISNSTYNIISYINVGVSPYGVAISPDGSTVYVTNSAGSSVSVINTSENKVLTTISVGTNLKGIAVSPDGSKVYVCGSYYMYVIDAATNLVIKNVPLNNYAPSGITVSPDNKSVYIADINNNALIVVNTSTYQQTKIGINSSLPDAAYDVVTSPDGSLIYVTGGFTDNVFVINATTLTLVKTISLNASANTIAISADGSRIYVTNPNANTVSVVNTTDDTLIASVSVGQGPFGISLSLDGSKAYVTDYGSNTITIINTSTNQVSGIIPVGASPISFGNFVTSSLSCSGPPTTFTITVNPSSIPTITASTVTGNITGCEGTASSDVRQFTVSGSGLTANITATAPLNFEISLNSTTGFSNSLTLTQVNGTVSNTIVYVRAAATAPAGSISGNVDLTSAGATNQAVVVSYTIDAISSVDAVVGQTLTNGATTSPVNFSGTAATYNWVNDTPGIGLAASGTGNIPSFTAINNTNNPITATITVTPLNGTSCSGTPIIFTITVNPSAPSTLTATANLSPLATIYGTPSSAENFTVSGTNITGGITITISPGFEVSNNGSTYNSTTTISGNGTITSAPVYIRLTATTPVGSYTGGILIGTNNGNNVNLLIPLSIVSPAPLTISADNITKPFGAVNPPLTVTYSGFVNNDSPAQLTTQPVVTTTALTQSPLGQYPITVSDAVSPNYTFTYIPGILTVEPSISSASIPNTFTPNGDGINDTWEIKYLDYYPKSTVNIFNRWGQKVFSSIGYPIPWDGTYKGTVLPSGTYYYIIDPKDGQAVFSGWLAIIK